MVVKVTFHDNDYGEVLENIAYLWHIGFHLISKPVQETKEEIEYYIKTKQLWDQVVLNPNFRPADLEALSKEDHSTIIGIIRAWIIRHIELCEDFNREEQLLLIRDLDISLTFTIDESNQNGEYLYYIVQDRVGIVR